MAKTGSKIKVPIILMAWPLASFLVGLVMYLIINIATVSGGVGDGYSLIANILNIVLFVIVTGSIVLGIPSFVIGLILLILRLTGPTKSFGLGVAGMVLGIVSVLSSFVAFGLIVGTVGICLSAASLKRGSSGKGMAITGLVTSIVGVFMSVFFLMVITIAAYAGVSMAAKSASVEADAMKVSTVVEGLYAANGEYPTYIELDNDLSRGGSLADGVNAVGDGSLADKVGMYGSLKDIEYIPCYGDGGMIWYWNFATEKYMTIDHGDTSDCQY